MAALRVALEGSRQDAFRQLLAGARRNDLLRQTQTLLGRLLELQTLAAAFGWAAAP